VGHGEETAVVYGRTAKEYLQELGMQETGLDKLITASYKLLNLLTFFTSGEMETRAWTVRQHAKAPEAAGVIHTDFIKGFVKADVVNWKDFVAAGGWGKIKETGKMRLEGKEYVMKDGDVCYFHINA
jgi:ribosome-binding ATPase YchF (GTP1/OBG family)